jgi:hypothetical protein
VSDKIYRRAISIVIFLCLLITITSFLFVINSRFYYKSAMRYASAEMAHRIDTVTLFTKVLADDEKLEELVVPYVKSLDANILMEVADKDGKAVWRYEQAPFVNEKWKGVRKDYKLVLSGSDDVVNITYSKFIQPPIGKSLWKAWTFSYRDYIGDKDHFQEHNLIGRDGPLLTYALLVGFLLGGLYLVLRPAVEKAAEELAQMRLNRDKMNPQVLENLIAEGEGHRLEFKETLQFNTYKKNLDKEIIRMSMKTIAALLNSEGGTLLIGVADDGTVKGLDSDLNFFKNALDGFELKLHDLITDQIKPSPVEKIEICFPELDENKICRIDVKSSNGRGVYHLGNDVYIRQGNRTKQLEGMNLTSWVKERKK